jgi:hypothetical protein
MLGGAPIAIDRSQRPLRESRNNDFIALDTSPSGKQIGFQTTSPYEQQVKSSAAPNDLLSSYVIGSHLSDSSQHPLTQSHSSYLVQNDNNNALMHPDTSQATLKK